MRAVGQDRHPGPNLLAGPVVGLGLPALVQAHVPEGDAPDHAVLDDERSGRVAVVDLHAATFGLLNQELNQA